MIVSHRASSSLNTSKSRLAVDREFMYIGSAGPGPGGRAEGRADGRMGGRADGRTDGRTGGLTVGRADVERRYNDFHRFSQNAAKTIVFFCHFASDGSASIDFYCKNENVAPKTYKIDSVF